LTWACPWCGRLGALVRTLTESLPGRLRRELDVDGQRLVLQGNALLVAGDTLRLSSRSAAVLRALTERPGWVVSRAELLRRAWPASTADEHAVEAAVARLRAALGPHGTLIRTVPKRGYRLAVS
jgi:uroporphyrinogen-III synthase